MTYHHLTYAERIKINALLQLMLRPSEIAIQLERPKCTIYRELKRNSTAGFYFVESAEAKAKERQRQASSDHCDDNEELWERVILGLKHSMSPKQIEGRLKMEGGDVISASSIYARVKAEKALGGDLWLLLRKSRKTYRRTFLQKADDNIGEIKNRVSIDERADIVDYRQRTGDLEGDTMIGANLKSALLTLNDRVTKKVIIKKLKSKSSDHVAEVMAKSIHQFKGKKHTCTLDNGTEFSKHEDFTEITGITVYFCHPRAPEERGSNENTNGLIRQFLPKGTDFSKVKTVTLKKIEYRLNSRPRKNLGYLTPIEAEQNGKVQFYFFN